MSLRTRAFGVAVALLLLVGCSEDGLQRTAPSPDPTPSPPTSSVPAEELAAQKAKAEIADCPTSDPQIPAVAGGLPDLTLPCLGGGRPVRLAGLRGQPMVLNVWGQWCPPCRAETSLLVEVGQQAEGKVLMLGINYVDRPDAAIAYADEAGWTIPQVADQDKQVTAPLKVTGPPQTVFVDASGKIVYYHSGPFTSAQQLRDLIANKLQVSL